MTNRERAATHVAEAERLLAARNAIRHGAVHGPIAVTHVTLALYYQREADRAGEA